MTSESLAGRAPGTLMMYAAFWRYAQGARGRLLIATSLLLASQAVKLGVPWLAAQAINKVQTGGSTSLGEAGWLVVAIFTLYVLSWAMHGPGRILERSVSVHVRRALSDRLYARLGRLPLQWHERHHSGETLHRVQQTTGALYDFAQSQFIYLQTAVNLAGPIVALMLLSEKTGIVAAAGLVLIGVVIVRFDNQLMTLAGTENQAERRYSAALVDFLGNVSTIIGLRLQEPTRRLLADRLEAVFRPLRRSIVLTESKWCAVDLLTIGLTWGLVVEYAWRSQVAAGTLLIGDVFMLYQYAQQAGGVIGSIASHYQDFARKKVDFASAAPILDAAERPAATAPVAADWRTIRLEGIEFHHARKRGRAALAEVTLTLERGARVAVVGPSGAGKSTLLRLLAGLYDAEHGRILVDGRPQPGLRNLGAVATLIPQDAEVFEASIRENLTLGAEHAEADLHAVLQAAALDAVVAALPNGLDTPITERGFNLSGGQKQRLALARGLLAAQASSLVLLDEPTSNLDPTSEARIFEALDGRLPDATLVASVHRMNLLERFDQVILMQAGRVVATGSARELLATEPLFRELWADAAVAAEPARIRRVA